jgi:hypothetical protein
LDRSTDSQEGEVNRVPDPLEQQMRRSHRHRRELRYGFIVVVGGLIVLVLSLLLRNVGRASGPIDLFALVIGFAIASGLQRLAERRRPAWFRRGDVSGARPSA